MEKENFYIYQEDLIQTKVLDNPITISGFVSYLNGLYCGNNMKKMRSEKVISYLHQKKYIEIQDNIRIPTKLGEMIGIFRQSRINDNGQRYDCLVLTDKAQQMLLDNFYKIIK